MASVACPRFTALCSTATRRQLFTIPQSSKSPLSQTTTGTSRPSIAARIPPPQCITYHLTTKRPASTDTTTTTSSTAISEDVLTWNRFFDLRRKRRYLNLASSFITGGGAVMTFGPIIAQQDIDGWAAQLSGLDPLVVLGITTFAVGAGGWLCGPSFGTAVFKIWAGRKGWNGPIQEKEKSFFARVKRYRADPASSSPQNPIPDYYGEKIGSVKDYRRWLKDQRAFNLKKNKNML